MIRENVKKYLPWIFFAAAVLGWVFVYVTRVTYLLDADMSSEMVLSKLLADEHAIISPNWKYSTEIRVLNNQIFFSLFLAITGSFKLSRILSGIALFAVYALSYYYLCAAAGIKKYFPATCALLFIPFSTDYAYIILYGLYYIPHISISFLTIALILDIDATKDKKKKTILLVLLILLSVAAGLGGPRQIIVCFLPLLLLVLNSAYSNHHMSYMSSLYAFAGGGFGYVLNSMVLSKRYHFNGWADLKFTGLSFGRLETLIMGILHEYGYTEDSVFSAALIKNAVCFMIVLGVALYYLSFFRRKGKRDKRERFVAGALISMTVAYMGLYLFTDMYYEDRYAIPFIVFAAPLYGFALNNVDKERPESRLFPIAVMAAVVVGGLGRYPGLIRTDKTSAMKQAADSLTEDGYTGGYASYWNGNIMTELSEGVLEMFNWDDYVTEKIDVDDIYVWLQPMSHETKRPEGKCFILLSTLEETQCPLVRYLDEGNVAFRNAEFVAYGFESHEDMLKALSDFDYEPEAGKPWPNMTFYSGTYEVSVKGSGLEKLDFSVSSAMGEKELPFGIVKRSDDETVYSIAVTENTYHVEFLMDNIGEDGVQASAVHVERK